IHAARLEALGRIEHRVRELAAADAPLQRFGLEPRAVARRAGRVRAIARQQHAHVHLVRLRFEPLEEAFAAVPNVLAPGAFAFDHPFAVIGAELAPGAVEGDAALLRELQEVVLALFIRLRLPGAHGAGAQRLALVGDDEAVVDADGAAEASAGFAGTD